MRCDGTMTYRPLFVVHHGALARKLGPDVLLRNVAPKRALRAKSFENLTTRNVGASTSRGHMDSFLDAT